MLSTFRKAVIVRNIQLIVQSSRKASADVSVEKKTDHLVLNLGSERIQLLNLWLRDHCRYVRYHVLKSLFLLISKLTAAQ